MYYLSPELNHIYWFLFFLWILFFHIHWIHFFNRNNLAISAKKSRFNSFEPKIKSKNLQIKIWDFSMKVRKTKNKKGIHSSSWPWKKLWIFLEVKWNFRILVIFSFPKIWCLHLFIAPSFLAFLPIAH